MVEHPLLSIFVVGIILRLVVGLLYQHVSIYPDSKEYIYLAKRLSMFDLDRYLGLRTPGYPLLIVLGGNSLLATIALQSIIGILTLLLFYKMLLRVNLSKSWALLLSLAMASYLPIVFFELAILTESLTLFFVTALFYFLFGVVYQNKKGISSYLAIALVCAYLVFIKPFYIFLPFCIFAILLFHDRKARTIVCKYALILILPLVVFLSWSAVNKKNTGRFVCTTFYGYNMAQTCVSFAENTPDPYKKIGAIYALHRKLNVEAGKSTEMSIWDSYVDLSKYTRLRFVGLSALLYDYSLATIEQNPTAYLKQVGISWLNFWKPSFYWHGSKMEVHEAKQAVWYMGRVQCAGVLFFKLLFVLLIPYNLYLFIRKRQLSLPVIVSFVVFSVSIMQALVTYGSNARFSFPFESLILVSVLINMVQCSKRGFKQKR